MRILATVRPQVRRHLTRQQAHHSARHLARGLLSERGRLASKNDHGLTTVEAVLTIPIIVIMILGAVQIGVWWYSRQLAETAAQQVSRAARAYMSTADAGTTEGYSYLTKADSGNTVLQHPAVRVTRNAKTVTATVTGDIVSIIPWVNPTITVTVTAPVETYVPSTG